MGGYVAVAVGIAVAMGVTTAVDVAVAVVFISFCANIQKVKRFSNLLYA